MDSSDLYTKILGISDPWYISAISLDDQRHQITVHLSHLASAQFKCSKCGTLSSVYDHQNLRQWRHLDTCQYATYLKASVPRVKCGNCGVIKASISWAEPYSRFSEFFECMAIDALQNSQVITTTALQLRITSCELNYLMNKSVKRGLSLRQAASSPIERLAIDEKSLQTGHHYVTILSDSVEGRVLEVSENRTIESVERAYNALNERQLSSVKSVSMDMWSAFESVTKQVIAQADIVHDRFHLSAYLNKVVDMTRRAENKKLVKKQDTTLQTTKYLWLKNPTNLSPQQAQQLDEIMKNNTVSHLVSVYELKEKFKTFFNYQDTQEATDFFNDWYDSVQKSNNTPLIKVADMFKKHFSGILNYVIHRVTNAIAEGLNSRIQQLKAKARGFKSAAAFRIAILFHFGKLHLYP